MIDELRFTQQQRWAFERGEVFSGLFLNFSYDIVVDQGRHTVTRQMTERMWTQPGNVRDHANYSRIWYGRGELLDVTGLQWNWRTSLQEASFRLSQVDQDRAILLENATFRGHTATLSRGFVKDRNMFGPLHPVLSIDLDYARKESDENMTTVIIYGTGGAIDLTTATNYLISAAEQERRIERENIQENGELVVDIGFNQMQDINESLDVRWGVGLFEGYDSINIVQDRTSISGTKRPHPYVDHYVPRPRSNT